MTNTPQRIKAKCDEIAAMLIEKNESYGDSALHPIGVFGKGDAKTLLGARIDDKLSRIKNQPDAFGEDAVKDLMGYLVMWMLAGGDALPTKEA